MPFKKTFLLAFLSAWLFTTHAQTDRKIDVLHYSFTLSLSDLNDSIAGIAKIKLVALDSVSIITLDLASLNKAKKGMVVGYISSAPLLRLNTTSGNPDELSFKHQHDKLLIELKKTMKKNDTATLSVSYKGIPADGLIISRSRYGRRTFFSDNWPNRGHNWIPCVDDPADKATVEFIVYAPSHYEVVSNGALVKKEQISRDINKTHWKEPVPLPVKIMVIGAADFAIKEEGFVKNIPVSTWVYPENKETGFYDYAPAKDILAFFVDYIGPYPYEKLANIQSKTIFGGMENAGAIFYNENYVNGRRDQYALMAHEIAHQWFGDMVTEKSFSHLWLSEGFANCLSIYYMEKQFGADTAKFMRAEEWDKAIVYAWRSNKPVVDSVSSYMELLNANSYEKGGWVLHMLRAQLGDSIFRKAIQTYYTTYAGKNANTRDLEEVFEKISGKDLRIFFQQWLYMPDIPRLMIKWNYSAQDKKVNVTIRQLQKNAFQFPLELLIHNSSGKEQLETIQITQASQSFSIPVAEKPLQIQQDPGVHLLFEGIIEEVK